MNHEDDELNDWLPPTRREREPDPEPEGLTCGCVYEVDTNALITDACAIHHTQEASD